MALEQGSESSPLSEVKVESQIDEVQVYYKHTDWEDSYAETTIVSDSQETPEIYVDESSYMYHESQMEYKTVIMPAYQIRTHTGKRPYVCESCNMTVMPNNRPWNHIRILGGGQPIVRHVYYMNFTRKSVCTPAKGQGFKPKKVGKGKRMYPCDKCERVFGHKSHLDNHLRTHSGEKPFSCLYCGKRFGQKSNLTSHMRRYPSDGNSCSRRLKGLPKIKEELQEASFGTDSSLGVPKIASNEYASSNEILTEQKSVEKSSKSLVGEGYNSSGTALHEMDSCAVTTEKEVCETQPCFQEATSSVIIPKQDSSLKGKKNVLSQCSSTLERSSSPPLLKGEGSLQSEIQNVVSFVAPPKNVLFQIKSQRGSSVAHPKQGEGTSTRIMRRKNSESD